MTEDELVALVRRVMDADGATEAEDDALVALLERHVPHPAITDLIFHTHPEPTAEQVVAAALAYRPIAL
ncbi:bacteriocin immunity protein [Streptomyces sp. CA-181903]|uniref:bacteriocin immunity protein n=1 Tax=Streptomyces sp. CA-181903 TaxID=3240055 RepID=UPI003D92612A